MVRISFTSVATPWAVFVIVASVGSAVNRSPDPIDTASTLAGISWRSNAQINA